MLCNTMSLLLKLLRNSVMLSSRPSRNNKKKSSFTIRKASLSAQRRRSNRVFRDTFKTKETDRKERYMSKKTFAQPEKRHAPLQSVLPFLKRRYGLTSASKLAWLGLV